MVKKFAWSSLSLKPSYQRHGNCLETKWLLLCIKVQIMFVNYHECIYTYVDNYNSDVDQCQGVLVKIVTLNLDEYALLY